MNQQEHPLHQAYEAFDKQDLETTAALLADDVTYRMYGVGPISGSYEGRDATLGLFARLAQETDAWEHDLHDVVIGDEHAVALVEVRLRRGDQVYKTPVCQVVHVNNRGQFTDVWWQPIDEYSVPEDFWVSSRLRHRPERRITSVLTRPMVVSARALSRPDRERWRPTGRAHTATVAARARARSVTLNGCAVRNDSGGRPLRTRRVHVAPPGQCPGNTVLKQLTPPPRAPSAHACSCGPSPAA